MVDRLTIQGTLEEGEMVYQEATGWCKGCGRQVMIRRKGTNHVFHLLMCIPTVGFWLIIWILCAIKIGGWRCTQCGMKASRSVLH